MIDGIPNRPLYFYEKDIIGWNMLKYLEMKLQGSIWPSRVSFLPQLACEDLGQLTPWFRAVKQAFERNVHMDFV